MTSLLAVVSALGLVKLYKECNFFICVIVSEYVRDHISVYVIDSDQLNMDNSSLLKLACSVHSINKFRAPIYHREKLVIVTSYLFHTLVLIGSGFGMIFDKKCVFVSANLGGGRCRVAMCNTNNCTTIRYFMLYMRCLLVLF